MKKLLIAMCMLLVITSVVAVAAPTQAVDVKAPYLLEKVQGNGTVYVTFTMNDYAAGYVEYNHAIWLRVGAPGTWTLNATVTGGGGGTIDALYAKADGGLGWVDLGSGGNPLKNGSNGVYDFWVNYRVYASQLAGTNATNIHEVVTVTYGLI